MNFEQAQRILSTHHSDRDGDGSSHAELDQARALLQTDPELARWYAAEKASDEEMRSALRSISPPADLRERILVASKITPFPARSPARYWLAAAACVLLGTGAFLLLSRSAPLSPATLEAQIPQLNAVHKHELATKPESIGEIRSWLAANGGVGDFEIPKGMKNLAGIACEVASIDGTKVTILCFHLEDQNVAHLYVVDRSELKNPPGTGDPRFEQIGETAIASWSQNELSYFLSGSGDAGFLQRLL